MTIRRHVQLLLLFEGGAAISFGNKHPHLTIRASSSSCADFKSSEMSPTLRDFKSEASGVFGAVRLAALFPAGAILGSVFAMPVVAGEPFGLGIVKRLYLLLGAVSVSASLVSVTFSTAAINEIAFRQVEPSASLADLLARDFDLFYTGSLFNFYVSTVGMLIMLLLRVSTWNGCPLHESRGVQVQPRGRCC